MVVGCIKNSVIMETSRLLKLSDFSGCENSVEGIKDSALKRLDMYGLVTVESLIEFYSILEESQLDIIDNYVADTIFVKIGDSGYHVTVFENEVKGFNFPIFKVEVNKHK